MGAHVIISAPESYWAGAGWWKIGSKALPHSEFAAAIQAFEYHASAGALYARNTLAAYRGDLFRFNEFIERTFSQPATLANFTMPLLQAFVRAEIDAGFHPHTIARRIASLRAFNLFLNRPIKDLEQLSILLPANEPRAIFQAASRYLQPAHISALRTIMEQAPQARARRDLALLALLLETGLPVQRLLKLNLTDLRADCRVLSLMQPSGRYESLVLDNAVLPLQRYIKEGRPELNCRPEERALWISQTGRRMTRQAVWQAIRGWGRRAGLPFPPNPRLLSYIAVQHFVNSGLPLKQIQLRLGHRSSLSTLSRLRRITGQGLS